MQPIFLKGSLEVTGKTHTLAGCPKKLSMQDIDIKHNKFTSIMETIYIKHVPEMEPIRTNTPFPEAREYSYNGE